MSKKATKTQQQPSTLMPEKVFDFYGCRKIFYVISAIIMVVILLATFIFGVDASIEFKGGTMATYGYNGTLTDTDIAKIADEVLETSVRIQTGEAFAGDYSNNFTLSFTMDEPFSAELQEELLTKFQEAFPEQNIAALESNDVAPTSGKQFLMKCLVAAIFAVVVLICYIAWRFKRISGWSAGVFAIVALLHDLIVVYGTFVICGYEIDANFIAVILTILGYSVNDTIVIYDRIRENQDLMQKNTSLATLVNVSLTQTMRRTLRTATTATASMVIVTILAAVNHMDSVLRFSIPLMVGMISGCYSSVCFAPMLWVSWKTRKKSA